MHIHHSQGSLRLASAAFEREYLPENTVERRLVHTLQAKEPLKAHRSAYRLYEPTALNPNNRLSMLQRGDLVLDTQLEFL